MDLTSHDLGKKRKINEDHIEFPGDGKRRRSGTLNAAPAADELSLEGALATWGRGDDDTAPSTKMLKMLELLREWESTGDKTIIYSQCEYHFHLLIFLSADSFRRDIHA